MHTTFNLTDTRVSCIELAIILAEINRLALEDTTINNENGTLYANISGHFTESSIIMYIEPNNANNRDLTYQYTDIETCEEFQYDTIGELLAVHTNVEARPDVNACFSN